MSPPSVQTKRVYEFEGQYFRFVKRRLWKDQPMLKLRNLARRIAKDNGKEPPKIVSGRGLPSSTRLGSYCDGEKILLCRDHRNFCVLMHEMAHFLQGDRGHSHGPAFVRRYFDLLSKYAKIDRLELELLAAVAKVKT